MVYGGIEKEHLQLNEDTLWSGAPKDTNSPKAKEILKEGNCSMLPEEVRKEEVIMIQVGVLPGKFVCGHDLKMEIELIH